ncbi:MAG: STAS/SEC14 domain-containing protein [Gammaproteobacteria bacterium]|nr:MAG: STAS/SEC14 domain-containing protein [Gammaproteobacteria bacterium]
MTIVRHGLTLGIERIDEFFFLSLKVVGKLTHKDYERINPLVDAALEGVSEPKINVFIDASKMEGWELRAAWDDFKFGLKHNNEFNKIAIFGHEKWQEYLSKIGSWFISGEIQFFETKDLAFDWLTDY